MYISLYFVAIRILNIEGVFNIPAHEKKNTTNVFILHSTIVIPGFFLLITHSIPQIGQYVS